MCSSPYGCRPLCPALPLAQPPLADRKERGEGDKSQHESHPRASSPAFPSKRGTSSTGRASLHSSPLRENLACIPKSPTWLPQLRCGPGASAELALELAGLPSISTLPGSSRIRDAPMGPVIADTDTDHLFNAQARLWAEAPFGQRLQGQRSVDTTMLTFRKECRQPFCEPVTVGNEWLSEERGPKQLDCLVLCKAGPAPKRGMIASLMHTHDSLFFPNVPEGPKTFTSKGASPALVQSTVNVWGTRARTPAPKPGPEHFTLLGSTTSLTGTRKGLPGKGKGVTCESPSNRGLPCLLRTSRSFVG